MSKQLITRADSALEKILGLLETSHRPLAVAEIARKLGFKNQGTCKNALVILLAENKVAAEKVGVYWLFSLPYKNEDFSQSLPSSASLESSSDVIARQDT
jgi:hypothetical protein